jgi:hypothetical protein
MIFPCGSEVGLELHRSLRYSTHFEIFGGSSIDDHGKYIYEQYIEGIPYISDDSFITHLKELIEEYSIDAIFPALDIVLTVLKDYENELNCKIIGPSVETSRICQSKDRTYSILSGIVPIPKLFSLKVGIDEYPVFMKPSEGYGSRGAKKINNLKELNSQFDEYPKSLILEYLPGDEYTVDCFTDRFGALLFVGPRVRQRVRMGISVNTRILVGEDKEEFKNIAHKINSTLCLRGAWFFQLRKDKYGVLKLLEVAGRIGGSTGIHRANGVNLPLLSVWDAFDVDVNLIDNDLVVEMDRALECKFKMGYKFYTVYVDFDDCILIDDKVVNYELVALLYKFINEGKSIVLLSRHAGNLTEKLKEFRLFSLFDKIVKLNEKQHKSSYIESKESIFIDDSFSEREEVFIKRQIPVFSPSDLL